VRFLVQAGLSPPSPEPGCGGRPDNARSSSAHRTGGLFHPTSSVAQASVAVLRPALTR
jgi:hypothetical protein